MSLELPYERARRLKLHSAFLSLHFGGAGDAQPEAALIRAGLDEHDVVTTPHPDGSRPEVVGQTRLGEISESLRDCDVFLRDGRRAVCMGKYTLRTRSGVTPPVYRRDEAPHRLLFRDDANFWRVATDQSSGIGSLRSVRASATIEGVMSGKSKWMFRNAVGAGFTMETNIQLCGFAAFWEKMKKKEDWTAVIVPYGVTEIPNLAFNDCKLLTSVVLPVTVRKIGWYAFSDCTSLTANVIPDSVTTIGVGAFRNCTSLTTASIPSGATLEKDYDGDGPFFGSPTTVTTRG